MLTQARLKELLNYDPETGIFTWIKRTSNRICVGATAGRVGAKGYIVIGVLGGLYRAHRLAWLYMKDEWPSKQVDHRNNVRADNRWDNLRDITGAHNQQNRKKANKNNKVGLCGVSVAKGGFFSRIHANGAVKYLGYFRTEEEAHAVYIKAKTNLHEGWVQPC